jgi:hypothetical protein
MNKLLFGLLFMALLVMPMVLSDEVAYVYRNERAIEKGYISVFEENEHSVTMIQDNEIAETNFSEYDVILIGNEILRNVKRIPVNDVPVIIANPRYVDEFGIMSRGMTSRMNSNRPLLFHKDDFYGEIYEFPHDRVVKNMKVHYIPKRYVNEDMRSIVTTHLNYEVELGDVVQYTKEMEGTTNKCFFGATETKYWAPDARYMFWECLDFTLRGYSDSWEEEISESA